MPHNAEHTSSGVLAPTNKDYHLGLTDVVASTEATLAFPSLRVGVKIHRILTKVTAGTGDMMFYLGYVNDLSLVDGIEGVSLAVADMNSPIYVPPGTAFISKITNATNGENFITTIQYREE